MEAQLDSIRGRVWMIPRNFLELSREAVGRGRFGTAVRGSVSQAGQFSPCTVLAVNLPNGKYTFSNYFLDGPGRTAASST